MHTDFANSKKCSFMMRVSFSDEETELEKQLKSTVWSSEGQGSQFLISWFSDRGPP